MNNPRLVTTGVTPMSNNSPTPTRCGIDWLQLSVEWPPQLNEWPNQQTAVTKLLKSALPPSEKITLSGEILRPMPGYNSGMGASHARLFWHTENKWQNIGVIMTGDDLRAMIAIPLPHEALIRWAIAKSKKISRLDFALDVFNPVANAADIMDEWKSGNLGTSATKVMEFNSYEKGTDGKVISAPTVYVGSRQSDRQLRVYDKRRQLGTDYPWTRIEIQLRDRAAWQLANAMVRAGIGPAGQQAIRDYVRIPELRWWNEAVTGETVYIEPVGKKETDTERWIRTVCLPAIHKTASAQIEAGRWELYDAVETLLADLLRETQPKGGK